MDNTVSCLDFSKLRKPSSRGGRRGRMRSSSRGETVISRLAQSTVDRGEKPERARSSSLTIQATRDDLSDDVDAPSQLSTRVSKALSSDREAERLQSLLRATKLSDPGIDAAILKGVQDASRRRIETDSQSHGNQPGRSMAAIVPRSRARENVRSVLVLTRQRVLSQQRVAEERYCDMRAVYGSLGKKNDRGYEVFARFLRAQRGEFALWQPVVMMLRAIHAVEQTDSQAERVKLAKAVIRDYLMGPDEMVSGVASLSAVYVFEGDSRFARAVANIKKRVSGGKAPYSLFSDLTDLAFTYLDRLYFCSDDPRKEHHFHQSLAFRELASKLSARKKSREWKKGKEEREIAQWFDQNIRLLDAVTESSSKCEDEALYALLGPRLTVDFCKRVSRSQRVAYARAKGAQIARLSLAANLDLHVALQRIERARSSLKAFCAILGEGPCSSALLKDLGALLTGSLELSYSMDELLTRWSQIPRKRRSILEQHVLGKALLSRLRERSGEGEFAELQERVSAEVEATVCCRRAREILREGSLSYDDLVVLDRLRGVIASHGDQAALDALEFLREVAGYRIKRDSNLERSIRTRYLAVHEELVNGKLCASGLYALGLSRHTDLEKAYGVAYDFLCRRWLVDEPRLQLTVDHSPSKNLRRLRRVRGERSRIRRLLRQYCGAPEPLSWSERLRETVQELVVCPERLDRASVWEPYVVAKSSQVHRRLSVSCQLELAGLAARLAAAERCIRGDARGQGGFGPFARKLLEAFGRLKACLHRPMTSQTKRLGAELAKLQASGGTASAVVRHIVGRPLCNYLEAEQKGNLDELIRGEVRRHVEHRLCYLMTRRLLTDLDLRSPLEERVIRQWNHLLQILGDGEALRMTEFLCRLREYRRGKPGQLKAEGRVIWHEFLNISDETGTHLTKAMPHRLYFLMDSDLMRRQIRDLAVNLCEPRPGKTAFDSLATTVSRRLWKRYAEGEVVQDSLDDILVATSSRCAAQHPVSRGKVGSDDELLQCLVKARLPQSIWRKRLYLLAASRIRLARGRGFTDLAGYVWFKTDQIVGELRTHRLGLTQIAHERLAKSRMLVNLFAERRGGHTALSAELVSQIDARLKTDARPKRGNRHRKNPTSTKASELLSTVVLGEDLLEGLAFLKSREEMQKRVRPLVRAIVGLQGLKKTPYVHRFSQNELEKLKSLMDCVLISEIRRSLIQGGTLNPESIAVVVNGEAVLRIDEESFCKLCLERGASDSKAHERLFYAQLLPAILGRGMTKHVIPDLVDSKSLRAEDIRSRVPLISVLVAVTNGPWVMYESPIKTLYSKTFMRGFESPIQTQPDKELRSQVTISIDDPRKCISVKVERSYVVPSKPIRRNPPERVLERFRVCSEVVFDSSGALQSASVQVGDFRLDKPWYDLDLALGLVAEQLEASDKSASSSVSICEDYVNCAS